MSVPSASVDPAAARPGRWTRADWAGAIVAVLAFWAVAAFAWRWSGDVVPWDSKNHFYPMLRYLAASLAQGEWPLWNPYHFSGHPSVADPQSLLFTPTMVAFAWLVPEPSMEAFDLVVFAHLLLPALAVLVLFARRAWHPAGAVVAAMIVVLGGSAAARLQHTGMIVSYAFFVPALVLLEATLTSARLRAAWAAALACGLATGLMALGRDQVAFLCCFALAGLVVHVGWRQQDRMRWLLHRLPMLLAMALIVAAILAVPSLLTMQFLADSNRPAISYGVAAMNSLPPSSLATLVAPNIYGTLNHTYDYWGPMWDTVPEGTYTDRAVNYLFAGTLPAVLLFWQGIGRGRLADREIRFFVLLALCAVLYALGRYTPAFVWVFDHVPGVKLYRRPADATFHINIALAVISGYLLHRYIADPRRVERLSRLVPLLRLAAAWCVPAALVAVGLGFSWRVHHFEEAALQAGIFLACALLAMSLLWSQHARAARAWAAVLAVAVTGGELVLRNADSALNAEPASRYAVYETLRPSDYAGLTTLKRELAVRHAAGERPRVEIIGLGGAWQNASMVLGIEDTVGYNALRIADYERAVGSGENAVELGLRQFPGTFRGYRSHLAALLGLEYLVLDRPAEKLPTHFPRVRDATLIYSSPTMYIYRLAKAAPRAYVATRLKPVDTEEVLDDAQLPDFDRRHEALLDTLDVGLLSPALASAIEDPEEDEPAPAPAATAPKAPDAAVAITAYGRNAVTLSVETGQPGVLVLHDLFYPGWEVTVDGQPRKILRANLLFRGVEVPAGRHTVVFTFRPLSRDNLLTAAADLVGSHASDGEATTR